MLIACRRALVQQPCLGNEMSVLVTFETQGECLARPMDVKVSSSAEQFRSGPGRPLETHGGTRWRGASPRFWR